MHDPNEPNNDTDDLSAAMDAGIEAVTEPAGEPPAEAPGGEEPDAKDGEGEQQEGDDKGAKPEGEGKPEGGKPEGEPAKDATEQEITDLKLGEKASARFRELSAQVAELAPLKEALDKAGIKDIAELTTLKEQAKDAEGLVSMVRETGATPEQFGQSLDYLALVAAAGKGDRAAAEQAFTMIEGEYRALAQVLGKEVSGYDPLAEFPDLKADVENSDITRERALELAQARIAQRAGKERQQQDDQARKTEEADAAAKAQGRADLNALDAELQADPHYAAKREALIAKAKEITRDFPPAQWAAAVRLAFAAIPNPAPPVKPVPSPIRPGGHRPTVTPATFENVEDAMDAGIAAAGG